MFDFDELTEKSRVEFLISDKNVSFLSFKLKPINKGLNSHLPRVSLPLNSLREGYRAVQFHDKELRLIPHCYLLVRISISRVEIP